MPPALSISWVPDTPIERLSVVITNLQKDPSSSAQVARHGIKGIRLVDIRISGPLNMSFGIPTSNSLGRGSRGARTANRTQQSEEGRSWDGGMMDMTCLGTIACASVCIVAVFVIVSGIVVGALALSGKLS
ncbi:hypothetical protein FQN49_001523 [Arthroderma sp. PD_2]|nr:hypothetical protein FQN49_001523 [Arthroderma sp. PD_2]